MADDLVGRLRVSSESAMIGFEGWAMLMREAADRLDKKQVRYRVVELQVEVPPGYPAENLLNYLQYRANAWDIDNGGSSILSVSTSIREMPDDGRK